MDANINSFLNWSQSQLAEAGVNSHRLDSEIILAHTLNLSRTDLWTQDKRVLSESEKKIAKNKPDFSEKKLRVFIAACRETTVMQYISKSIASAFKKRGCVTYISTEENTMQIGTSDLQFQEMLDFKPHIIININHLNNEYISKDLTFLIRQLQPTQYGLPLELYIFTNDTNWVRYENIQSDIFDHLLAAVPMFELKVFQIMSGTITAKH